MGELFDQVCQFETLTLAAKRAFKGKQRKARVMNCLFHQETEIFELQNCLRSGEYQPEPYRYFTVKEPKTRDIAAAHIKDRIVHHAICHVLGHHFDSVMLSNSYACRKNKGQHKAIEHVLFPKLQSYKPALFSIITVVMFSFSSNVNSRT